MKGSVWIATYVLLWLAVLVLSATVVALLRQIGVLHTRLRPVGVHFADEGPDRHTAAPELFAYDTARLTLIAFSSPGCTMCDALEPGLVAIERDYPDVRLQRVRHDPDTEGIFSAFNVRSTPYFVTVDGAGTVQARGVANSLEQIEVLLEESLADTGGVTA